MPSPARPTRTEIRTSPAVIRADDDGGKMDPMDIVLGVVWAIVIPVGMYGLLYAVGMPPGGGGPGASWEEQMRRQDELKAVRPPVTAEELDMRLARVDELLQSRVPDYLKRAEDAGKDNRVKNSWQELAFRVLGICRSEIEQVQADVGRNPQLQARPEIDQKIRSRLAHIDDQENRIISDNPFPDRLRAAQAETRAAEKSGS